MCGLGQTDVEGLTAVGATDDFLYIANDADGDDLFADGLADNAIWKSLPFVAGGQGAQDARRHLDVRRPALLRAVHRRARGRAHAVLDAGR